MNFKNQIRWYSWLLILFTLIVFFKYLFDYNGFFSMLKLQVLTKDFNPPANINFTLFFFMKGIELFLNILILITAIFVMSYKNISRKILIYTLLVTIVFYLGTPIIRYAYLPQTGISSVRLGEMINFTENYSSVIVTYFWPFVTSVFFIITIKKFSKEEIRKAFH